MQTSVPSASLAIKRRGEGWIVGPPHSPPWPLHQRVHAKQLLHGGSGVDRPGCLFMQLWPPFVPPPSRHHPEGGGMLMRLDGAAARPRVHA